MLQENILDLNDKMNSLLFFLKGDGKQSTKSIDRDVFLNDLNSVHENLSGEVEKLRSKLPLIIKSEAVNSIEGFTNKFSKQLRVYMSATFKVDRAIEIIKGLEVDEIEISHYVANYFENVRTI